MNQAQPVAAGPNGFVMQFMYEHICGLAETTVGFHEEVQDISNASEATVERLWSHERTVATNSFRFCSRAQEE